MLCLLLTLIVTPVAYSLFAGMGESSVFHQVHAGLARLRMGVARVLTMHLRWAPRVRA